MSKAPLVGLRIDIETKSGKDIGAGTYVYSEDPDFEVLIIAYSIIRQYEDGPRVSKPISLDLYDQKAVDRFAKILTDPRFQKHAFNANFERVCLSRWLGMENGEYIDPENWHCSMVQAAVYGVQGTLDEVATALKAPVKKDARGRSLIRFFCSPIPARASRNCPCGKFHEMRHHPEKAAAFVEYCQTDVLTEASAVASLPETPEKTQREYEADQRINDRGYEHKKKLALAAVKAVGMEKDRLMAELSSLTGVENPNSNPQMLAWCESWGYPMRGMAKEVREEALVDPNIPPIVAEALELKGSASLSSVTKHQAALKTRCSDGRIRGSLQFYGAHTGREAGRGIQPQNLPRYEAPASDRKLLLKGLAGSRAPEIAKGSVRASIVPAKGHLFATVDYNAIEARVLGNLAGEKWVNDEFHFGDGAIYEATAEKMFNVSKSQLIADIKACSKCGVCVSCLLRGSGKVSNLALGYNGGAAALVNMGAEREGIDVGNFNVLFREYEVKKKKHKAEHGPRSEFPRFHEWEKERHDYPELLRLRDLYRENSPATVGFWKQCQEAWDAAARGKSVRFGADGRLAMMRDGKHNRMVLPSGRSIWYREARIHEDPDREGRIGRRTFLGKSPNKGHMRVDTFGGKLTENVTQAVARDALFDLIMKIEKKTAKGWPGRLVLHVHDEVVIETPKKSADQVLADVKGWMSQSPKWAPDLALRGAGDLMEEYKK